LGELCSAYNILFGKPEGKRLLGRLSHRWEIDIKMDHSAQDNRVFTGVIYL
jgi:hypothetical protein